MTEAIRGFAPEIFGGVTPTTYQPQIREVPAHLWKSSLIARRKAGETIPESDWTKRALKVEEFVQDVLTTQTDIIARVKIDDEDRDSEGPDLHIYFVEGFPTDNFQIGDLWGEVKASPDTIEAHKQKIRDSLPEGERSEGSVTKWLVEHRIILINGGVGKSGTEKTLEKILYNSFYPQLFRIIETGREGTSDEIIYGRFYPQITAIKQIILERQQAPYRSL